VGKESQKGVLLIFCWRSYSFLKLKHELTSNFFSALIVAEQAKTVAAPPAIAKETVLLQVWAFITA